MIPSMWRPELLHPLVAHFPVAIIPLALLFRVLGLFSLKKPVLSFAAPASRLMLLLGVTAAFASLKTGDIAEDVVNRVICNPNITQDHEAWAEGATFLALGALAIDLIFWKFRSLLDRIHLKMAIGSLLLAFLLHLSATVSIMQAGHLGASLVYQQGAAVYHPTSSCQEFE